MYLPEFNGFISNDDKEIDKIFEIKNPALNGCTSNDDEEIENI